MGWPMGKVFMFKMISFMKVLLKIISSMESASKRGTYMSLEDNLARDKK